MRHLAPLLFLLLLIERGANALLHTTTRTLSSRRFLSTVPDDTEKSELDKGYEQLYDCYIQCTFSGFNGLRDMPCNIELQKEFKVKFSGGLDSPEPGFWRAIRLDNGNDIIEATQPVFAEYMFYLDLWEKTLMWKGTLDLVNMRVTDGEVLAQKKRFGLFPYQETIATFSGNILPLSEKPAMGRKPSFSKQKFMPPDDFEDPYDMQRYPELFDPEYVQWWFEAEDAVAKGIDPPARPKAFFVPNSKGITEGGGDEEVSAGASDLKAARSTGKSSKGGKGPSSKGMASQKK